MPRFRKQAKNLNLHTAAGTRQLEQSIALDGLIGAITVAADGETFDGSNRINVLGERLDDAIIVDTDGTRPVVVRRTDIPTADDPKARRLGLAANVVTIADFQLDTALLKELSADDVDFAAMANSLAADALAAMNDGSAALTELLHGNGDGNGEQSIDPSQAKKNLAERFIVPPFSVLDARQGYWQDRKRAWIALGIESELGRETHGNNAIGDLQRRTRIAESLQKILDAGSGMVFDPVLCELAYRWFCPKDAIILDPFAGGSVRGIVAEYLGYHYVGIDLRPEQVAANQTQAQRLDLNPTWHVGDSRNLAKIIDKPVDFVFSCPPYFDLELYSEDPQDLSNAGEYSKFIADYRAIIAQAIALLKDNRFACIVVGDIRDKRGFYRNFVSDTIAAFQDAGATLYNDAILVTAVGSLPIRVGRQFGQYRKLGKTHQNVLVFYKGDIKKIPQELGEVEVTELSEGAA